MKSEKIKCNRKNHQPEKLAGFDWKNIGTDFKTVILQVIYYLRIFGICYILEHLA
jgi:hypothetical protein